MAGDEKGRLTIIPAGMVGGLNRDDKSNWWSFHRTKYHKNYYESQKSFSFKSEISIGATSGYRGN